MTGDAVDKNGMHSTFKESNEHLDTDGRVIRLMVGLSLTSFISLLAFLSLWLNGLLTFSRTTNLGSPILGIVVSLSLLATPVQFIVIAKTATLLFNRMRDVSAKHRFLIPAFGVSLLGFVAGLVILAIAVANF